MGTPAYMAPEQILGTPVDGRADQYALGIVAFEMFTGKLPFQAEGVAQLIHMQISVSPPPLSEYRPDLPEELNQVLARMMAKQPSQRFDSVQKALEAIGAALHVES
jgi:serine/threonine-protein kinase